MTKLSVSPLISPFVATLLSMSLACLTACSLLEGKQQNSILNSIDSRQMEVRGAGSGYLGRVNGHGSEITGVFSFSDSSLPGDRAVLSVEKRGRVLLWKIPVGEAYFLMDLPESPSGLAFCQSARLLAASYRNKIKVFGVVEGRELFELSALHADVTALQFAPDCRRVLAGTADGRVYQWTMKGAKEQEDMGILEKQKLLEAYIGHPSVISALAYHPLGRVFFSADWNGNLSAWLNYDADVLSGEWDKNVLGSRMFAEAPVREMEGESGAEGIDHLAVSSDGQWLAAARRDGNVELWQVRGFRRVCAQKLHKGVVQAIALSPDGKKLASAGRDGKVKIQGISVTGLSALSQDRFKFEGLREISLTGIVKMVWAGSGVIIAGDSNGKVMEIQTEAEEN